MSSTRGDVDGWTVEDAREQFAQTGIPFDSLGKIISLLPGFQRIGEKPPGPSGGRGALVYDIGELQQLHGVLARWLVPRAEGEECARLFDIRTPASGSASTLQALRGPWPHRSRRYGNLELYVSARTSQKAKHANGTNDGDTGLRASHQALLRLVDTTDPAWPSIAAVLREMADAGVELGEAAYEIAAKLGTHRHLHAMLNPQATRAGRPAYHQATLAVTGDSIIYYMRRGDLIKIGTTTEPAIRFGALMPDEILAFEPGGQSGELLRHRQFDHLRCQGEYFRSAPELLEHARQLRHLHGDPDPSWPTTVTKARTRGSCPVGYAALPPLVSHETITVAQASRRFGIKEHRVWGWVRRGLIGPAGRDGRRRLFYVEHIAAVRDRYDGVPVSAVVS